MAAKTNAAVTCTDKNDGCNIIINLNLVHIISIHADQYHYAETIQLSTITFAKIRILIENTQEHGNARMYRFLAYDRSK